MPEEKEVTKGYIIDLKEHYVNNLYGRVRKEQYIDNSYIEDEFEVPEIQEPHDLYRSGIGDRIVNSPAEHIVTSNPQVFFHPKKETKASMASAEKLSHVVNQFWLPLLRRQNPNIFQEFIKNLLGRGESFFKVTPNTDYPKNAILPINFHVPDSMVVYASPQESIEGVPARVIIYYSISQYRDLIPTYPQLRVSEADPTHMVTWLEYYDNTRRYAEAAQVALTKDGTVQDHVYGCTPFVRKYSGFGRRSPDGELNSLIVSDIRRSRDLIREECATRSNIASIEYLFAHKPKTFIGKGLNADVIRDSVSYGAYDINAIDVDPKDIRIEDIDIVPSPDTYKHHADLLMELNQRHPFIMSGYPWGTSGRQQDMTELSAMRRYDSVVENTENAFATALKIALKQCLIPGYMPAGVSEADLTFEYDIEVRLKAKDPIVEDRKITMGNRLWNGGNGSISLRTLHIEYLGMTVDESNKEIARLLADKITIHNPDMAAVMGMVAAEEAGMESWLEKSKTRADNLENARGVMNELPPSGEQRIQGEVQTETGMEESNTRGARAAPAGFTRG